MSITLTIFSCVGGGPMQRLADSLRARGVPTHLCTEMSGDRWRQLASGGKKGRLRARLRSMIGFPLRALARSLDPSSGVLVPTTNPFFVPVLLVATKALHGRPVVPLIYDLYPDAAEATGHAKLSPASVAIGIALNRFLFANADGIVFIGERMAAHAESRYGPVKNRAVFPTGAIPAEFGIDAPDTVCGVDVAGKVVISYSGNLGHVHDWATIKDGLAQLVRSDAQNACVIISASGPGVDYLERELPPSDFIHFANPTSDEEWRRLQKRTDIALVSLRDAAVHTSVPSKTFSAMAARSAIIAVAPRESDLADVIASSDCGVVVAPGNGLHLLDAIQRLVRDSGELERLKNNAQSAAAARYDIEGLAEKWQAFLDRVARRGKPGFGYDVAKRALDIGVSGAALLALSPLLLGTAAAVRLSMGRPVLFRQRRPGQAGVPFELFKFRSMRDAEPHEVGPEYDGARLTRVGKFIRKTSLDELPALLNVLAGDMSLVGPRPLLIRYLSRYTPKQARRHEVLPGITGMAQVSGRNAISWEAKFDHDVWYVDNRSLLLDLKIIARTALAVFVRSGISQDGHATMPEFRGSEVSAADV